MHTQQLKIHDTHKYRHQHHNFNRHQQHRRSYTMSTAAPFVCDGCREEEEGSSGSDTPAQRRDSTTTDTDNLNRWRLNINTLHTH
ncbi:unnamed protein product, partial [Ceratitis capitata]